RALLKYDTASHGFRFADVIDLVHPIPDPGRPWQGDLFLYALDRRHGRDEQVPEPLAMVRENATLRHEAAADARFLLDADRIRRAGMTWEDALSLAGSSSAVNKGKLWSVVIPSMGI